MFIMISCKRVILEQSIKLYRIDKENRMKLLKLFVLTMGLLVTTLSMANITVQADKNIGFETLYKKHADVKMAYLILRLGNNRNNNETLKASSKHLVDLTSSDINQASLSSGELHANLGFLTFPLTMIVTQDVRNQANLSQVLYSCTAKITIKSKSELDTPYVFKILSLTSKGCHLVSNERIKH
jgi:hypothetical protein